MGPLDRNSWWKVFEYTKANAALGFQCAGLLNQWLGMLRDILDKVWACTYTGQHKAKQCTHRYLYINGPTGILSRHPRTLHRPRSLCGRTYVRHFHLFDDIVWVDLLPERNVLLISYRVLSHTFTDLLHNILVVSTVSLTTSVTLTNGMTDWLNNQPNAWLTDWITNQSTKQPTNQSTNQLTSH